MALSYDRKSGRPISAQLVNEYIWRSCDTALMIRHDGRLSVRELASGAKLILAQRGGRPPSSVPAGSRLGIVFGLLRRACSEEELESLVSVAEVQLA